MAWLSILGMYEYNNDIFDDLNIPEGINKENLINNILLNCAELEIAYPEYDTLKKAIKIWSDSNQYRWNKLYETMKLEYNPIWNVDADIEETGNNLRSVNLNDNETINITDTRSVQGYNSTSWANAEKNEKTGTDNVAHTGTENNDNTLKTRRTGNIGVTTTQEMIKQEREIAEFNLIEYITIAFKYRFCIMIY